MKFFSGSGSDSDSDNNSHHNVSNSTNNNDDGSDSSDNESRNTSRTKSSDNNDSRNNDDSDVNDSDNESDKNEESDKKSKSDSDGSGSDSGSGSGSDSDDSAGSDSDKNESASDKSDSSDHSDNESGGGSNSDSSSQSDDLKRRKQKTKPDWEANPDMYGVRRSSRDRKQPERMTSDHNDVVVRKGARKRGHSSDSSYSDYDDDSPVRRRQPPKKISKSGRRMSYEEKISKRSARGGRPEVSYKESDIESESEFEEEGDGTELSDEGALGTRTEDENTQTIEKIIDHRIGKKGAVGMQTYLYEVERNGDPNTDFDPNDPGQCERQFLVKWKGWAHIHNTWESEESLNTQKYNAFQVKGVKKLENYLRKEDEIRLWRNSATPEEIEYMEIQSELEKNLYTSHLQVDRIFAEAEENGNNFFYVKWESLPYSESTWELETFIRERYPAKVQSFELREKSTCTPRQCPALKHRPKFSSIKEQPEYLGGGEKQLELRDYQMRGLNWLAYAWTKHHSVILADEMGLGKTIQAISFISYLFHSHHMYGPYIFVLPLSTINAWEREFNLWAPDINVIVYIGDRDSRKVIRDYEWSFSSKRLKFNVVLTTYEIVLRDKDELKECMWSVMAVDEAHRLKNEESQLYQALKEFKSNHRLLITGTPLQNSLKELWALLHFIMPEKFDDWSYFESQHDENIEKGFHKLHKQLEPFLLRRVKKDVEKSLPSKVEQILRVDMTKQQKQFYKWILTKNYDALRKGNRGSTSSFVNIVMELKKCCNHSFLTKPPEEIPHSTTEKLQQLLRGSGKLVLLDKLLTRLYETGHRVLIFSQMVRQLNILGEYLQMRRWPFQRLDGSIRGELRKQALDHFNAEGSPDFCFLLSTRAGGLGINLATADTVVIFDSDWNPQNDLQAQARAHRIGQKNQVNIYRLVTKNSIEENIIERAKQKMVLDHLVIQSMDTSGRTVFNKKLNSNSNPFNKEELNAILKFGADELFKDSDEETEEPVCDIDDILRRAETREDGPQSAGEDLLSAFKVASINLDEDEEVSRLDTNDENTKDWDDIIPESIIKEIKEEEKAKEMADLYLPPRNRKQVQPKKGNVKESNKDSESSSDEGSDKDDDSPVKKRGRPKGSIAKEKETVKGFSEAEVRRFFRSMKRFSNPLRRLDTISRDSDLRDKQQADLKRLAETIIERCKEFMADAASSAADKDSAPRRGKHGGNSFKLSGVSINAKTTLATLEELAPLDTVVPHAPVERAKWVLPIKKVKDTHWDTIWNIQDDSRLLCGIYEYGMGSWEQLKGDPALNLGDKILLDGDQKPQAKQLESRVTYLLKLIKKHSGTVISKASNSKPAKPRQSRAVVSKPSKTPKGITPELVEDDSTDDESKPVSAASSASTVNNSGSAPIKRTSPLEKEHKDGKDHHHNHKEAKAKAKVKEEKVEKEEQKEEPKEEVPKKKKEKKEKKASKPSGPVHITANGAPMPIVDDTEMDVKHPMWSQCKEKMRPMKKHLMALSSGGGDGLTQEQQIAHTKDCLLTIGDHITATIALESDDHMETWKVLLWRFVSKFTEYDAKRLHKFYKKTKRQEQEKEEEGGGDSKSDKAEKKDRKEERSKEKSSREEREENSSSGKRSNDGDSPSQPPYKKSYNGNSDSNSRDKWSDREKKRDRDGRREHRDSKEDRRDHRDRDRSRDRSGNYNRQMGRHRDNNWHHKRHDGGGRYSGGYHREGNSYNGGGGGGYGGYQRSGGDWRGNQSRPRPKHSGGYGPPHGTPGGYQVGPGGYPPHGPGGYSAGPPPMGGPGIYGNSPQGSGGAMYPQPHHYRGDWMASKEGKEGAWQKEGRREGGEGGSRGGYSSNTPPPNNHSSAT